MMKFVKKYCLLLFLVGVCLAKLSSAVPVSVVNNEVSNSLEDESDEGAAILDDDITTHGLERLSSAATCLVAGIEYTHGQQIYRKDPCEFCLCLDGEMFCWWQDCPPTLEGPCRDRGPFSPCLTVPSRQSSYSVSRTTRRPSTVPRTTVTTATSTIEQTSQQQNLSSTITVDSINSTDTFSETSTVDDDDEEVDAQFSSEVSTVHSETSEIPQHCIVMGREYKIGDKLPHDTGNCIECICGQGAKLSCSPHQCAPVGDDINDYRPPGPRQPIPDVF